jgi:hypothetical protein
VLASSAVHRGFETWSGQTKDYEIGISCFSAKHLALRSKSKDWLLRNQNNVSEWSDMSNRELLCQSGVTCLPENCCVRVEWHIYPRTVVSEWSNMSTRELLCQSGVTCLPENCCVRVEWHVYPRTVVSLWKSSSACWCSIKQTSSSSSYQNENLFSPW